MDINDHKHRRILKSTSLWKRQIKKTLTTTYIHQAGKKKKMKRKTVCFQQRFGEKINLAHAKGNKYHANSKKMYI